LRYRASEIAHEEYVRQCRWRATSLTAQVEAKYLVLDLVQSDASCFVHTRSFTWTPSAKVPALVYRAAPGKVVSLCPPWKARKEEGTWRRSVLFASPLALSPASVDASSIPCSPATPNHLPSLPSSIAVLYLRDLARPQRPHQAVRAPFLLPPHPVPALWLAVDATATRGLTGGTPAQMPFRLNPISVHILVQRRRLVAHLASHPRGVGPDPHQQPPV
jgi:hypothetical protein